MFMIFFLSAYTLIAKKHFQMGRISWIQFGVGYRPLLAQSRMSECMSQQWFVQQLAAIILTI
jgi:hypothetical protein